ncbi:MAG TPA: class I SAM-dependent methyltransferase [Terriglobales bacterium]|nr:class I SAM-dependent methyltransferase [Terriglobales bacterium]
MPVFTKGGVLPWLYRKILHKYYANDLWIDLRLAAKKEAVEYVRQNMQNARVVNDRFELLRFGMQTAPREGLVLEFGVMKGRSIRCIAECTSRMVDGFDSFEGLPCDWRGGREAKGTFSTKGKLPKVPDHVRLHAGWFDATLPPFLAAHKEDVAFLHVDCDIYESTQTVFQQLGPRLKPGAVIVFDEYFNYPGWRQHEFKAFQEFIEASGRSYEYIGFSGEQGHVAVRLK